MKYFIFLLPLILTGQVATSQPLPVPNETTPGITCAGGMNPSNTRAVFICEVPEDVYGVDHMYVFDSIKPFMTAEEAAASIRPPPSKAEEAELIHVLETRPMVVMKPALEKVLRARGCSVETEVVFWGLDFFGDLAGQVKKHAGYDGAMSKNSVQMIERLLSQVINTMYFQGLISLDDDQSTMTLVDCE